MVKITLTAYLLAAMMLNNCADSKTTCSGDDCCDAPSDPTILPVLVSALTAPWKVIVATAKTTTVTGELIAPIQTAPSIPDS